MTVHNLSTNEILWSIKPANDDNKHLTDHDYFEMTKWCIIQFGCTTDWDLIGDTFIFEKEENALAFLLTWS